MYLVSADGEYIAAGRPSLNDTLYFFNRAGELLWSCKKNMLGDSVYSLSMSADGKYVVTGRYRHEVYFIDSGVITTPSPASTPEHSSPTPEAPSYEAIFAISGLSTVAYLLLRRRRDRAKRG
jgi:WD40 repeat protein